MKLFVFVKPIVWLALICYGLFIPAQKIPVKPFLQIPHFDKMIHFAMFFVLTLLLFKPFKTLKLNHIFWASATSIIFGVLLESVQRIISPTRSSDIYDFFANVTGIAVSVVFFLIFVSGKKWEKLF